MPTRGTVRVAASWEAALKQGAPDYSTDVSRGKVIYGYILEPDETFFMAIIECLVAPGAYPFERAGIPVGGTVELVDGATGIAGITPAVGYDYIIKEFFSAFDQPVDFSVWQVGPAGWSCVMPCEDRPAPAIQPLLTGWSRNQVEPIAVSTVTRLYVENRGSRIAYGKCWIQGFMRPRAYTWF